MTTSTSKTPAAAATDKTPADKGKADDAPEGADDDAGTGADDAPAAGDGDNAKKPAAGSPYRPEGLPDHLYGKDDKETIDKLNGVVAGIRKDLAKKGVPETPDKYDIKLDDDIAKKVLRPGKDGKDPMLEKFKPIFHKRGVSNEAATEMVTELYKAVVEMGAAGIDPGAEGVEDPGDFDFKAMGGVEKAQPVIDASNAWLNNLSAGKKISTETLRELQLLTTHSQGVKALQELRVAMGEQPIPANLDGDGVAPPTVAEAEARMLDERYWKQGAKDESFIAETRRMLKDAHKAEKRRK